MFEAIADGFNWLFGLLGDIALWLLQGIGKLFQPIIDLIGAIFYFIYMLGLILFKVIELIIGVGKLLIGLGEGLINTFANAGYTGSTTPNLPNSYNTAFAQIGNILDMLQLDILAYIFMFAIWVFTAFKATKIIGSMGGGGE